MPFIARFVSAVALLAVGAACTSTRVHLVRDFDAARRAKDLGQAARHLGEDPRIWYEAKDELGLPWKLESGTWSAWDEYFRGAKRFTDWSETSDSVSAVAWEINDYYRLLDRGEQPVRMTWYFDATDRITGLLVSSRGLARSYGRVEEFRSWARTHAAAELDYLAPGGEVDPTGDRPARHRSLLVRWREESGLPRVD